MVGVKLRQCCFLVGQLVFARAAAAEDVDNCAAGLPTLDTFTEDLHLRQIPFVHSPNLFLARFEFSIEADLSDAFLADQFDLFPKPLGKLVNAHPSLTAFEATLTRGRWKDDWGPLLHEFRPSGASLVATTESDSEATVDKAWTFLISALSGTLCASFEGMDPRHKSMPWVVPMQLPWAELGRQLRFATLPYEPVCTENLSPWLKLLPCGRKRGLAALISPLAIAESPLSSLAVSIAVNRQAGRVEFRTSLDVVHPLRLEPGLSSWFTVGRVEPCASADTSRVLLLTKHNAGKQPKAEAVHTTSDGSVLVFPTSEFIKLESSAKLAGQVDVQGPNPWATVHWGAGVPTTKNGLSVTRDILSQEGQSERTHGRYLLRFANDGTGRRIRFMDQLPFFISPMWHTFQATLQRPGEPAEEFTGLMAMQRLQLKFVPPDSSGPHSPIEVFLTVDLPPGGTVSVTLDVLKKFIRMREFSFACEKGFDVSAAAWLEVELPQEGNSSAIDDFIESLAPKRPEQGTSRNTQWRFRFTQGLIVLVPMPDFSMPFNVIALSSTALTFFFGSIFRLTASGRSSHWVMKDEEKKAKKFDPMVLIRVVLFCLFLFMTFVNFVEEAHLKEWEETGSPEVVYVVGVMRSAKDAIGKFR